MRLFVAVFPPDEVMDAIAALPRPELAGLRWTTPDQWHVTLRFLGQVDEDALGPLATALAGVADSASEAPVRAELGPATDRFGRRILQIPAHGLDELAAATVAATAGVGEPPDDRPFAGHLTLARSRGRRGADLGPLAGTPFSARWRVHHLVLVRSHLGAGGARYEALDRWPLRSDAEGR